MNPIIACLVVLEGEEGGVMLYKVSCEDPRGEDSTTPIPLWLRAHPKSPLVASYYGSSDQSRAALQRTSVLANSLLILAQGPISTCVWFGTTVSVTLRLSLRGQGGAPATLLSGKEHTHKESEGWRETGE